MRDCVNTEECTGLIALIRYFLLAILVGLIVSCSGATDPVVHELQWTTFDTLNSGIYANDITAISASPNGSIWLSHYPPGFSHFTGDEWHPYDVDGNSPLYQLALYSVAAESDSILWVGSASGAHRLTSPDWQPSAWPEMPRSGTIYKILIADDGGVWMNSARSIWRLDGDTWTESRIPDDLLLKFIVGFAVDGMGVAWVAVHGSESGPGLPFQLGGVGRYSGGEWHFYSASEGVPDGRTWSIAAGKDGDIWVGMTGGVSHLSNSEWKHYRFESALLSQSRVQAIAEDRTGSVWFGTQTGLVSFDGKNWTTYTAAGSELSGDDITCIIVDANNDKWIGTWNSGITRLSD